MSAIPNNRYFALDHDPEQKTAVGWIGGIVAAFGAIGALFKLLKSIAESWQVTLNRLSALEKSKAQSDETADELRKKIHDNLTKLDSIEGAAKALNDKYEKLQQQNGDQQEQLDDLKSKITMANAARAAAEAERDALALQLAARLEEVREKDLVIAGLKLSGPRADDLPQMSWSTDASGNSDWVSEQWAVYAGQGIGGDWKDICHPDDYEPSMSAWTACLKDGSPFEHLVRIREHLTGTYRAFVSRGIPKRDSHGTIIGWRGTCTDLESFQMQSVPANRPESRPHTAVGDE